MSPSSLQKYKYDQVPDVFDAKGHIPIECPVHGTFMQQAYAHIYGNGCIGCQAANNVLTTKEYIKKSISRFGSKFNYSKTQYTGQNSLLVLTCPQHGDFEMKANLHLLTKHGCPKCNNEIPRARSFQAYLEKAIQKHGSFYDYSRIVFKNANEKVEIICPKHGSFMQTLSAHVDRGNECPKCAKDREKLTLEDFLERSKKIHGDKYDYSDVAFETLRDIVSITCKKHGKFTQAARSHIAGNRCKECYIEENWTAVEDFIANARKVHGDKYDYSRVRYRGSKKHVEIICPIHGSFWLKPNGHISSRAGCRLCYSSKGETAVAVALEKYGIRFIREYRLLPAKFRYDFYLPDYNAYFEFHGHQHYFPVDLFGGVEGFKKTKERDFAKTELVKAAGAKLFVLSYRSLESNTVEKDVIRALKKLYLYWVMDHGEIKNFRTAMDLCRHYRLNPWTKVADFRSKLLTISPEIKILF